VGKTYVDIFKRHTRSAGRVGTGRYDCVRQKEDMLMIKWEKPMLISLSDATEAKGACEPGSGDDAYCRPGNAAGSKCEGGVAAAGDCIDGNAASAYCGVGS
jgi:hypothetical protein